MRDRNSTRAPRVRAGWLAPAFLLLATLAVPAPAAARARAFGALEFWPAGPDARAIALADVDGDGDLDALVANGAHGRVTVVANDGAGGYSSLAGHSVGGTLVSLAAADFNVDGDPDVVAADESGHRVAVLLGAPGAGFASPAFYPTGAGPRAVAIWPGFHGVAPGFVTANASASSISTFENDETGIPVERLDWPVGGAPRDVVAVDFIMDGLGDVAVATPAGVELLTGRYEFYDRYFYFESEPLAAPAAPEALLVADLGASGWNDLVATSAAAGGMLSAWPGDGQSPFGARADVGVSLPPAALAAGDLDGDGDIDVATASAAAGAVAILINENGALAVDQVVPVGESVARIAAGDVDGDGVSDIVGALPESGRIVVLRAGATAAIFTVGGTAGLALAVSPNPARGAVTLRLETPPAARALVRITDVAGRVVLERALAPGERRVTWEPRRAEAPAGVYFASLESRGARVVQRIARVE